MKDSPESEVLSSEEVKKWTLVGDITAPHSQDQEQRSLYLQEKALNFPTFIA